MRMPRNRIEDEKREHTLVFQIYVPVLWRSDGNRECAKETKGLSNCENKSACKWKLVRFINSIVRNLNSFTENVHSTVNDSQKSIWQWKTTCTKWICKIFHFIRVLDINICMATTEQEYSTIRKTLLFDFWILSEMILAHHCIGVK